MTDPVLLVGVCKVTDPVLLIIVQAVLVRRLSHISVCASATMLWLHMPLQPALLLSDMPLEAIKWLD